MFGPKPRTEYGREDKEGPLDPSRRKLLGMMAGAGAAALARPTFAFAESVPAAQLEAARATGIRRLREAAVANPDEVSALFVKKRGTGNWADLDERGIGSFTSSPSPESLKALLKDPDVSLELFHTHTAAHIAVARGKEASKDPTAGIYPMPPSFQDIIELVSTKRALGRAAARYTESVIDPSGTWTYDTVPGNRSVAAIGDAYHRMQTLADRFPKKLLGEARDFVRARGIADEDPRLITVALLNDIDSLEPALKHELEREVAPMNGLYERPEIKALMEVDPHYPTTDYRDPLKRQAVLDTYRRAGIMLTYASPEARTAP